MPISIRQTYFLIALSCVALLGYGYYLQFVEHLEPCPMCIFQRLCYMTVAAIAVIAGVHNGRRMAGTLYSLLVGLVAIVGAGIAARQTWLQHLPPDQVPECGPGLDFMLEMYPLLETIKLALVGTGDCAQVDWRFLSLSIAEWSLVCFAGLTIASIIQLVRTRRVK